MPDQIDPYKILQVDSEAEDEVIQAAYRRLARKYHPDLAASPDAATRMAAINAAWELIGEPAKRVAYDRQRAPLTTTPVQPAGGAVRAQPGSGGATAGRRDSRTVGRRIDREPSRVAVERRWHVLGRAAAGGDRLARLDLRAVDPGQRL